MVRRPSQAEQEASRHRSVETGPVSEESEVLETDSAARIKRLIRNPIIAVGGGLPPSGGSSGRSPSGGYRGGGTTGGHGGK